MRQETKRDPRPVVAILVLGFFLFVFFLIFVRFRLVTVPDDARRHRESSQRGHTEYDSRDEAVGHRQR
jgi:hypothetical protein